MAHSVSHDPPPPPPLFSFLKTIQCLAVTFNLDSKYGTKDRHWLKQKCGVQFLNSPADFGRSPSSAPRGGSANELLGNWGVNRRDAHAYLQLSDINIWFAEEKIDHLYFYLCFVFSKGKNAFYLSNPTFYQCEGADGEFYTTGP